MAIEETIGSRGRVQMEASGLLLDGKGDYVSDGRIEEDGEGECF